MHANDPFASFVRQTAGNCNNGYTLPTIFTMERFSFECRKVFGIALTTPPDWFKTLAPLFHPVRSKTKPIGIHLHAFSRALRQLHVIAWSFDWFTGLSVSFVIG